MSLTILNAPVIAVIVAKMKKLTMHYEKSCILSGYIIFFIVFIASVVLSILVSSIPNVCLYLVLLLTVGFIFIYWIKFFARDCKRVDERCEFKCRLVLVIVLFVIDLFVWILALYLFQALPVTDKSLYPWESRDLNKECFYITPFDYHDLWHISSAIALGMMTLILILMPDLEEKNENMNLEVMPKNKFDDIEDGLKQSKKLLNDFRKKFFRDKCLRSMMIVILVGVLLLIIYAILDPYIHIPSLPNITSSIELPKLDLIDGGY